MTIPITPYHSNEVIQDLDAEKPITVSRWGDGEWYSTLGRTLGTNCDGHHYFPDMGKELAAVLHSRPRYTLCMQPFVLRLMGDKIEDWIKDQQLTDLTWADADVFHRAAIRGELEPIMEALNRRQVIFVGPDHLKRLKPRINYTKFVDVPPINCYLEKQRIVRDVLHAAEDMHGHIVVAFSSGMPAEIFIDALYPRMGACHSLIDFGSVWDPLVGVLSRTYMRKPEYKYSDNSKAG